MILFFGIFFCLNTYSQSQEFTTTDLIRTLDVINFKGVKVLKGLTRPEHILLLKDVLNNPDTLYQLNVNAWFICDHKKIDNLEVYNYYYNKKINRATYNQYCKEINALMMLDGTVQQPK
ncbi:hypothetical protein JJC03_04250 [Flavobacterium oreochromis]|uniref:hypothetical protein n=1 Tax=Flavobacterium oreochromis TaxID=2906078 RepID=UPI001CE4FF77|nr:hypothetical protein [Flavobacterium oreochromis]QYS87165.1 hypothetical protein JJC03_04250 [Flavobacterium oreochromis]